MLAKKQLQRNTLIAKFDEFAKNETNYLRLDQHLDDVLYKYYLNISKAMKTPIALTFLSDMACVSEYLGPTKKLHPSTMKNFFLRINHTV